jgi:hypothetical protein
MIRDQILFVSGKLNTQMYGPSVKPPQPPGLWEAVSMAEPFTYVADEGDAIYRRSLYTYWRRGMPPPQMTILNAPSREFCTARRERTNTPLQALLLMNEAQYVEAARHLARRALNEPELTTIDARVRWLFETVTVRLPREPEVRELVTLLEDMTAYYDQHPELAGQLLGTSDPREAAWSILASTLLNLDEVVSK